MLCFRPTKDQKPRLFFSNGVADTCKADVLFLGARAGNHVYTLPEYGLDPDQIRDRFETYMESLNGITAMPSD